MKTKIHEMEKIKIVQMIVTPNNSEYQGILLGLGSDGVVYRTDSDNKWHIYLPCVFADKGEDI